MSFMWRYFFAMLTAFLVAPELRRIQDWILSYGKFEIWSILPLVMLIPFVYAMGMNGRYRKIPPIMQTLSWLWIGGFTYGLFLSFLQHNMFGGLLTYAQFVLPLAAGLWVATEDLPAGVAYNRILNFIFISMTFVCVYGVIQWAVIPPWDALWLANIHASAFGNPVPFQLRAFSTLNAPGLFGNFAAMTAIFGLQRISTKDWRFNAAFMTYILGMGVTIVRTSWVMFGLGAVIYFVLTRRVQQLFTIIAVATVLVIGLGIVDPGNPIISSVGSRVSSFSDIQGDESYNQRSELYVEMIPEVLQGPVGMGLGMFGAGGKMNPNGTEIDSGVLSRVLEMGWVGFFMFSTALLVGITFCLQGFIRETRRKSAYADIYAVLIAMQVSLIFLESSGEAHFGILAVMFWVSLGAISLPLRKPLPTTIYREQIGHTVISGTV